MTYEEPIDNISANEAHLLIEIGKLKIGMSNHEGKLEVLKDSIVSLCEMLDELTKKVEAME